MSKRIHYYLDTESRLQVRYGRGRHRKAHARGIQRAGVNAVKKNGSHIIFFTEQLKEIRKNSKHPTSLKGVRRIAVKHWRIYV